MILVDAHEDLAWNMLTFGRDYTRSAAETRDIESSTEVPARNGDTLLGWDDYQRGEVALIFATLFAAPLEAKLGAWDTQHYATPGQAHQQYRHQLDAYYRLVEEHPERFRLVLDQGGLREVLTSWGNEDHAGCRAVGLVPLMEGAECVRTPDELEGWWERGVRIIGPAWRGTRFCGGTLDPGPLTPEGYALLDGMAAFGFALDISHMDEAAVLQALDAYPGEIIASHSNAAAVFNGVQSNRFLSDRVIKGLIERDGVIGVVPFNRFLNPSWHPSDGREQVSLRDVVAHIDHICQIAGDACHVGIGSDFDGGFGLRETPSGIDTIADLQKLAPLLAEKGYTDENIAAVLGQNWIRFLTHLLPA